MTSSVWRLSISQHFTSVILWLLHWVQFNSAFTRIQKESGRQKFFDMVRSSARQHSLQSAVLQLDIFLALGRLGIFLGETVQHFGKCFRGNVYSPWEHQSS